MQTMKHTLMSCGCLLQNKHKIGFYWDVALGSPLINGGTENGNAAKILAAETSDNPTKLGGILVEGEKAQKGARERERIWGLRT